MASRFRATKFVCPSSTKVSAFQLVISIGFSNGSTGSTAPDPAHFGGHLVVNGQDITIPDETVVILPANALTWAELFDQAPPPYAGTGQTGLAQMKIADLERDADQLERVTALAQALQGNAEVTAVLVRRWLGEAAGRVLNRDAVANPDSLGWYEAFAREHASRS